jgi:hypothetical protein
MELTRETYWVYWDSETQTELARGKITYIEEIIDSGIFGGGNYNVYPAFIDTKIVRVFPRGDGRKLRILYEEE